MIKLNQPHRGYVGLDATPARRTQGMRWHKGNKSGATIDAGVTGFTAKDTKGRRGDGIE